MVPDGSGVGVSAAFLGEDVDGSSKVLNVQKYSQVVLYGMVRGYEGTAIPCCTTATLRRRESPPRYLHYPTPYLPLLSPVPLATGDPPSQSSLACGQGHA